MKLRPGNHVYAETDSEQCALQVRRALEAATGQSYTITPGVNRIFAVRKLVPSICRTIGLSPSASKSARRPAAMALADYRLCDKCGRKAFYDATLDYDFHTYRDTGLCNLGDWAVLCRACSKRFECVIVEKPTEQSAQVEQEGRSDE